MDEPIYYDTETCGLHGVAVLIQYAHGDGPVELFSPWVNPIRDTLELIQRFMNHPGGLVGFNLAFDHFHLCKLYTMFSAYWDWDAVPEDIVNELADLERSARLGPCIKPVKCCDLMMVARKGPYQSTMDRGDIRIKKVPTQIVYQLAQELEHRIPFNDIYFARSKVKHGERWKVMDIVDDEGVMEKRFKDIVLKFNPSTALKALAVDALGVNNDEVLLFGDAGVNENYMPDELGYAPFAHALGGDSTDWKRAWPEFVAQHNAHWLHHKRARKYATDDVIYTRNLYKKFGCPELGDDDSELTCMVAAVRWRGYKLDLPKLRGLLADCKSKLGKVPTAAEQVKHYVLSHLSSMERLTLKTKFKADNESTRKQVLETIAKFRIPCPHCNANADMELTEEQVHEELADVDNLFEVTIKPSGIECSHCNNKGSIEHPAASKAQEVLDARAAEKEIELYEKLLTAGRFHASFKVIGTLSSRMSGTDGLNAQAIKKTEETRSCFPLADDDQQLSGGDFSAFEVTLAEAKYGDPKLRKDLLTCEHCRSQMRHVGEPITYLELFGGEKKSKFEERVKGKVTYEHKIGNNFYCQECGSDKGLKIHAIFGTFVYPGMTYEEIKATEKTKDDKYTKSKQSVFAMIYGGEDYTLQDRLGVELEIASIAFKAFQNNYPGIAESRKRVMDMFQTMKQPDGIGKKIHWNEPADYIESMFGFRRYFTLENRVCKELFEIANKPPKIWSELKIKVQRRDREQTLAGATQSALYAAAFALQASNTRAAANHEIQSSGSQITKRVQRKIWELQPSGIHEWLVQPMNIHDELMTPCKPEISPRVKEIVNKTVESFRPTVPLIRMDWVEKLTSWAEKG